MNLHLKEFNIPKEILKWGDSKPAHQRQHIGTHIDCYNLSTIELPSEIEVKVIDVRNIDIIDVDILDKISIEEESFIIFRTGYLEKYGYGSEKYFNTEGSPYLTNELVDKLLDFKVKLIGIDLSGIQHGKDHVIIDKYIESKGAYVVENICNLDKVDSDFKASLNWIQSEGATAIKVEIETKSSVNK
ncbi:cyclase family protein [Clostridium sp. LP20]|uniref:cyclase family protein n=1 Tax=Clostridium sp. LP20 TaxID=3418665 RepID=UPI003EE5B1D6